MHTSAGVVIMEQLGMKVLCILDVSRNIPQNPPPRGEQSLIIRGGRPKGLGFRVLLRKRASC